MRTLTISDSGLIAPHGPAILAQDSFDRANGALGTADVGGVWTNVPGTDSWGVVSNKAQVTGVSVGLGVALIGGNVADLEQSLDITETSPNRGYVGLTARYIDTSNYYVCNHQNGSAPRHANIYKVVSGVATNLLNFDVNTDTYRLGFRVQGNVLSILKNGLVVATIVDNTFSAAGRYGMMFWTGSGWSDFIADNYLATG